VPGTPNPWKGYAALAIACAALALGIHAELRGAPAPAPAPAACVDQAARDQVAQLRRAVAERDAALARLPPSGPAPGAAPAEPAPAASTDPGPRRYVRFDVPNPAVRVTQKDDGTLDIHSTDPALAGSVLTVTAISESGAEDRVLIRVP
jgi:hypothetical protein